MGPLGIQILLSITHPKSLRYQAMDKCFTKYGRHSNPQGFQVTVVTHTVIHYLLLQWGYLYVVHINYNFKLSLRSTIQLRAIYKGHI